MTADLLTKSLSRVKFFLLWSSVYKSNSKSTPNTSTTKLMSSQAATEGECWSQSRYDLTMIKSTDRILTVFVVGIRDEQVKRLYSGVSAPEIGNYSTSFPLSSFHSLFPLSPITLSAS